MMSYINSGIEGFGHMIAHTPQEYESQIEGLKKKYADTLTQYGRYLSELPYKLYKVRNKMDKVYNKVTNQWEDVIRPQNISLGSPEFSKKHGSKLMRDRRRALLNEIVNRQGATNEILRSIAMRGRTKDPNWKKVHIRNLRNKEFIQRNIAHRLTKKDAVNPQDLYPEYYDPQLNAEANVFNNRSRIQEEMQERFKQLRKRHDTTNNQLNFAGHKGQTLPNSMFRSHLVDPNPNQQIPEYILRREPPVSRNDRFRVILPPNIAPAPAPVPVPAPAPSKPKVIKRKHNSLDELLSVASRLGATDGRRRRK